MKRSGLAIFLVIVIIILLILLVWCGCRLYHAKGGRLFGGVDCRKSPAAQECRPRLTLGEPGVSVWADGTVSLAAPIENHGHAVASDVKVTFIGLGSGTLTKSTAVPARLGAIAVDRRGVLLARVVSLAVPATYTLTLKGTYKDTAGVHGFDLTRKIEAATAGKGPLKSAPISLVVHRTSGVPIKSAPPMRHASGDDNDRLGRPTPEGPPRHPFKVSPAHTGLAKAPAPGTSGQSISITRDTTTRDMVSFPPDPAAAAAHDANVVLQTDNTYLEFSQDGGKTFTRVDPNSIFPAADNGICCDQVVIYDPDVGLFFWLLQYSGAPAPTPADPNAPAVPGGPNRLRIAYASPAQLKANINSWTWVDLTQSTLNSMWPLDYPDLAFSGQYLWISVDATTADGSVGGLTVTRLRLSDITGSKSTVTGATFGPNQSGDMARANAGRLVQDSSDGAYWAGKVDTSDLQVFRWRDADDNPTSNVTGVNLWCDATSDYANLAPDGLQWPDDGHAAGTGAIVAGARQPSFVQGNLGGSGRVWFGWGSGRDDGACNQGGRPMPYVKIVQIDGDSLNAVGEYHIWNPQYAFAYPSLGTDAFGNLGVMVSYGGPGDFASTTVGYLGDYVVYYTEQSDVTLRFYITDGMGNVVTDPVTGEYITSTRYGDYFTVRNSGLRNTMFSAQGYELRLNDPTVSNKCLNGPTGPFNCTMHPHYIQWGRPSGG